MPRTRTLKFQIRKLFVTGRGKTQSFLQLDLSPPRPDSTRTYALAVSGLQARDFPAVVPNKESTHGIHANYLTAEGLSL